KQTDDEPLVCARYFLEMVVIAERFFRRLVMHAPAVERDLPAVIALAVDTRLDIEMQKGDFTPGGDAGQRFAQCVKRVINNGIDAATCGVTLFFRLDQQA